MNEVARILLVEDDPQDVELTMAAFEEIRIANEVVVLHDGAEAIDFLFHKGVYENALELKPAVVLLDLKLPKVSGIEVLKAIRDSSELQNLPVVILTSSREERDLLDGYRFRTNAYVVKPVDYREFIAAVKEIGLFWTIYNEPPPGSVRKP